AAPTALCISHFSPKARVAGYRTPPHGPRWRDLLTTPAPSGPPRGDEESGATALADPGTSLRPNSARGAPGSFERTAHGRLWRAPCTTFPRRSPGFFERTAHGRMP